MPVVTEFALALHVANEQQVAQIEVEGAGARVHRRACTHQSPLSMQRRRNNDIMYRGLDATLMACFLAVNIRQTPSSRTDMNCGSA